MAVEIFYSYAHEDEGWRQELVKHLTLLQRQGYITSWHDRIIGPGSNWRNQIDEHLNSAGMILLLISADFLASDYCYDVEMKRALERSDAQEAAVVPILLRPCDWDSSPFGKLQALPSNALPVTRWSDRDEAFTDIARGLRQMIVSLPAPLHATVRALNVPPRNPYFTGREEVLHQLQEALSKNGTVALAQPQVQAISGLGGIGKTQTAIEYAHQHRDEYRHIFWLHAETEQELASDYATIADVVGLATAEQKQDQKVALARRWLEQNGDWLLILDNADDLSLAQRFLPSTGEGHVILTSRAHAFGKLARRIEIERMAPDVGALFLLRRAAILNEHDSLEKTTSSQRDLAHTIVREVDGLPLALEQAGAYMEETDCGLDGYLQRYRRQRTTLLNRPPGTPDPNYRATVATTWNLSFQKVEAANPAAADLLRLCAFLAPDAIPEEIITEGASELGPNLESLSDPLQLDAAIQELRKYSLIKRDPSEHALSLHRLVQIVLLDQMDEATQHTWAEHTIRAVNEAFPDAEYANWPQCKRLLPQAQVCATLIEQYQLAFSEAADLLGVAAYYLQQQGQYVQAQPLYQRALDIREQMLGPEHRDTGVALNNLGLLYFQQGQYEQAEPLYLRALKIYAQVPDPDDPVIASTLDNLGELYRHLGRYEQAEQYYQRALDIRERVLGEHPSTSTTFNNLGNLYQDQGKYEQAEPLLLRSLKIKEQVLELYHPGTAATLLSLGVLYQRQGRYEEAESLYQRALAIWEKVFGMEHPDIAACLEWYASLLRETRRGEEAEGMEQRARAIGEKWKGM